MIHEITDEEWCEYQQRLSEANRFAAAKDLLTMLEYHPDGSVTMNCDKTQIDPDRNWPFANARDAAETVEKVILKDPDRYLFVNISIYKNTLILEHSKITD